jgi:hypothetical protein
MWNVIYFLVPELSTAQSSVQVLPFNQVFQPEVACKSSLGVSGHPESVLFLAWSLSSSKSHPSLFFRQFTLKLWDAVKAKGNLSHRLNFQICDWSVPCNDLDCSILFVLVLWWQIWTIPWKFLCFQYCVPDPILFLIPCLNKGSELKALTFRLSLLFAQQVHWTADSQVVSCGIYLMVYQVVFLCERAT